MTNRRHVLQLGACLAANSLLPRAMAADSQPKTLLILGGTGFIGPHLTQEALRLGWRVTHFNRGKRSPRGVADVETLIGDRNGQIDALRGRKWDVVIDDTGQIPKYVKMSAELLAPNVGYCLYISSISAYASFAKPNDENSPTGKLANPDIDKTTDETYGPMKALCEQYSAQAFKGRASIVRPGYIVGPLDGSDRFTYWPVRASKGGEMLAPGTPHDPIQIIDVRDLAAWMMKLAQERTTGYFNAISPPRAFTMGDLITASLHAQPKCGHQSDLGAGRFPGEALETRGTRFAAVVAHERRNRRRLAHLDGTRAKGRIKDAADAAKRCATRSSGFTRLPADRQAKLRAGLDSQKEIDTLRAWHISGGKSGKGSRLRCISLEHPVLHCPAH